jgi:hypothetical protein
MEARTIIPPKEDLEINILAVLCYCYKHDAAIELRKLQSENLSNDDPLPKPFFKPMTQKLKTRKSVRDCIMNQLAHVRKDCLSDVAGINLFCMNAKSNKIYCCRGSSGNETDNKYIDLITGNSVGLGRCDRLLSTFFEISNENKRRARIGECASTDLCYTHRTECLAMVNSYTKSAGWKDDDMPFKVSNPAAISSTDLQKADIGFDVKICIGDVGTVQDVVERQVAQIQANTAFLEEAFDEEANDDASSTEASDDSDLNEDELQNDESLKVDRQIELIVPLIRN